LGQAHPCGKLKPNDLGLFDMHGNVEQWTHDIYNDNYDKLRGKEYDGGELVSPTGVKETIWDGLITFGSDRVCRGGQWKSDAGECRAATRHVGKTNWGRYSGPSFRLARVPVEGK
jgi:formylglycine-generating enzyme required for sulfatase activity